MLTFLNPIVSTLSTIIGKINWKATDIITPKTQQEIAEMLKPNYYIILTRHNNHLSTYAISFAHFFLTGKWGYYGHALLNAEDEVASPDDFRLVEAIGTGVRYAPFDEVFGDVSSVALLKPKSMSIEYWTSVLDKAKNELGKPYDTLFDLKNDNAVSCVELVRTALMAEPNYSVDFANFEKMIAKGKNLDPQMFFECPDFEVVYEVRTK